MGKNYKLPIFFFFFDNVLAEAIYLLKYLNYFDTNFLTPLPSIDAIFYQSRLNVYCEINWIKERHILTLNLSSSKKTQRNGMFKINWTQAGTYTNDSFGNMHKLLKLHSLVESQYVDLIFVFFLSLKIARYQQKPWGRYNKDAKKGNSTSGDHDTSTSNNDYYVDTRSKCVVITPLQPLQVLSLIITQNKNRFSHQTPNDYRCLHDSKRWRNSNKLHGKKSGDSAK